MDGDLSQYDVDIDLGNVNTSHSQVADLVGRGKRVLDVGCWTGELGRVLVARGCEVSGLEIDEAAAEVARTHLGEVVVADLDGSAVDEHFPASTFDVVVFADVLEHLRDPVAALRHAANLLVPDGKIVISVPNITHGSVRLSVLQGRWTYTETGLLDATHIRFFNRAGLQRLFADAGMVIDDLRGTIADPLSVEVVVDADRVPPEVVEWVRHQRDAMVYQFVVGAHVRQAGEPAATMEPPLVPAVAEETVRAHDKYTERTRRLREEKQQALNVRDHIIGLEAATATAQARASAAEKQLRGARKRLERKNERIKQLADQLGQRKREEDGGSGDVARGALDRLRRGRS